MLKTLWVCDNDNIGFYAHWGFFVLILACIFYVISVYIAFQSSCGRGLNVLMCWSKEMCSRNSIL